jgi:hypothetical protein
MANLAEVAVWETGVYRLQDTDPVQGYPAPTGDVDGVDNLQAKQLTNRTKYLKTRLDTIADLVNLSGVDYSVLRDPGGSTAGVRVGGSRGGVYVDANSFLPAWLQGEEGKLFVLGAGAVSGASAPHTELHGGDIRGTLTGLVAGDLYLRGGFQDRMQAGGTGYTRGNIALHMAPWTGDGAPVSSWNGMQKGTFVGNAFTAPTADPSNGYYAWSDSGFPMVRVAGIRVKGPLSLPTTATGGARTVPTTCQEFLRIQVNGNDRLIALFAA